jgi:hypothetical protein
MYVLFAHAVIVVWSQSRIHQMPPYIPHQS